MDIHGQGKDRAPEGAVAPLPDVPHSAKPASEEDRFIDLVVRWRWLYVVPILLPLSTLFKILWAVRDFYVQKIRSAPEDHEKRVRGVREQVQSWHEAGAHGLLCTARKNWMSVSPRWPTYKGPENTIRVELYDILALDTERRVVRVEPQVTMGQLTGYLIPKGWTLPVMPELDDLTVGGLFLGYGIEVSSHKYGLFNALVESCDVVLGDGRLVHASPMENADLFYALPWSCGSLGFVVALSLKIIPCKPYVYVTNQPVHGLDEPSALVEREASRKDAPDFIEGILFSRDEGVIVTGNFADRPETGKVNPVYRWYKPWFALRCRDFLESGPHEEYIPLRHFYRRHERGMYWECEHIVPFGNHPLFRLLFGWMMPPKISLLKLTQTPRIRRYYEDKHILQDALVPIRHLKETIDYFDEIFEGYPVWLCPMKLNRTEPQGFVVPADDADDFEMYVDVAVVTVPGPVLRGEAYSALDAMRKMEKYLLEHRGFMGTYAVIQLTREEFRQMFDCTLYDQVRKKYGAEGALMDVYNKLKWSS